MGVIKDFELWKFYDEAIEQVVKDKTERVIDEMVKEILESHAGYPYFDIETQRRHKEIVKKYLPQLQLPTRWASDNTQFQLDIPYMANS